MLTTGETAKLLGVTAQTIINWMESGKLPFVRVGRGRRKILPRQIRVFVESQGLPVSGLDPGLWAKVNDEPLEHRGSGDPPLLSTNSEGTSVFWSQSARERYGWTTSDVVGKAPSVLPARVPGLPVDLLDLALPSGNETFRTLLLELQAKDGKWLATEVTVSWIYDARGGVAGTVFLLESPMPVGSSGPRR
ncbi:MAG TPA: excisionase family DNA-binding protein [Fibrobacteria bacterium]|nr:excisionase family DNA-binding protein [Fibrobacteria bacterium]